MPLFVLTLPWWKMICCFFTFLQFFRWLLANKWSCTIKKWQSCVASTPLLPRDRWYRRNWQPFVSMHSSANNYCWIWLVLKDTHCWLLFCFGFICMDSWFITYINIMHSLWYTMNVFSTILCTSRHDLSFKRLSGYAVWNPNKSFFFFFFFFGKNLCNILLILIILILKDASISRYVTWWSCFIRSLKASIFFRITTDFGYPLRNTSYSESRPLLNSLYQHFTVQKDGALSLYKELSSSKHSCIDNLRWTIWKITTRKYSWFNSILWKRWNFQFTVNDANHVKTTKCSEEV